MIDWLGEIWLASEGPKPVYTTVRYLVVQSIAGQKPFMAFGNVPIGVNQTSNQQALKPTLAEMIDVDDQCACCFRILHNRLKMLVLYVPSELRLAQVTLRSIRNSALP